MSAEEQVLTGRLLLFSVGSGRFALLLEDVVGVQDSAEVVFAADGGVMFQGRPVVAVDARSLWRSGADSPAATMAPAVIVVSGGGREKALMIDRVEGIVEGVEMRPLPALVAPFVHEVFRGVTLHEGGDRLVVDPVALSGATAVSGQGGPGKA